MAELKISVVADVQPIIRELKELGGNDKFLMWNILRGIGSGASSAAKKNYQSSGLQKRTGLLYRSIKSHLIKSKDMVEVYSNAESNGRRYGFIQAAGATITPKNFLNSNIEKKYLVFQIDGKWIKAQKAVLSEHDFLGSPIKNYLKSSQYRTKLDSLMQKEINRIERKNSK